MHVRGIIGAPERCRSVCVTAAHQHERHVVKEIVQLTRGEHTEKELLEAQAVQAPPRRVHRHHVLRAFPLQRAVLSLGDLRQCPALALQVTAATRCATAYLVYRQLTVVANAGACQGPIGITHVTQRLQRDMRRQKGREAAHCAALPDV